jgi:S-adenosylmethionine/arginine decarboxylase-like enzyme
MLLFLAQKAEQEHRSLKANVVDSLLFHRKGKQTMEQMGDIVMKLALGVEQAQQGHWRGKADKGTLAKRDVLLQQQFAQEHPWGLEASIDLFWCHPERIRDPAAIHAFAVALCDFIHMHRYGEPLIVHFGKEAHLSGYTLVQLIETSNITAHFIDHPTPTQGNAGCLNIFSCAWFSPHAAAAFCQEWFEASEVEVAVTFRGPTQPPKLTRTAKGEETCQH